MHDCNYYECDTSAVHNLLCRRRVPRERSEKSTGMLDGLSLLCHRQSGRRDRPPTDTEHFCHLFRARRAIHFGDQTYVNWKSIAILVHDTNRLRLINTLFCSFHQVDKVVRFVMLNYL